MKFKPIDVARECEVSANTIRNWGDVFGAFLLEGTRADGNMRTFSERDVEVLKHIAQLRRDGMPLPQILLRLRSTRFGEVEHPPANLPESRETVQETLQTPETALVVVEALREFSGRLQTIEARQQVQEQEQKEIKKHQWDVVLVFGAGVLVSAVFFLLIVLLFSLNQ